AGVGSILRRGLLPACSCSVRHSSSTDLLVNPIQKRFVDPDECWHRTYHLTAKTTLEAIDSPKTVTALHKLFFQLFNSRVRDAPKIIDARAVRLGPAHGFPLKQISGHQVAAGI